MAGRNFQALFWLCPAHCSAATSELWAFSHSKEKSEQTNSFCSALQTASVHESCWSYRKHKTVPGEKIHLWEKATEAILLGRTEQCGG